MAFVPIRPRAPQSPDPRPLVTLGIGCVLTARHPHRVRTILGSCVAVILYVPRLRLSTLCHAQSPEPRNEGRCREACPHPCRAQASVTNEFRYVTCCISAMLTDLSRLGCRKDELVATVVGGANVVKEIQPDRSVSGENVRIALEILGRERIRVARTDVGGNRGRTIVHLTDSNELDIQLHSPPK